MGLFVFNMSSILALILYTTAPFYLCDYMPNLFILNNYRHTYSTPINLQQNDININLS